MKILAYSTRTFVGIIALVLISGCASAPPSDQDNVCSIFDEKKGWYKKARKAYRRWGTPIPVMMSFARQESSFRSRARPPRKKILWIIPGPRPASAFGFAQATNETWKQYKKATGGWGADRNEFGDAMDFIGWYNDQSNRRNNIKKSDAYNLYLAYHEGQGGYAKRSYRDKKWLTDVATRVSGQASTYATQLNGCEKRLNRNWFMRLFTG